MTQRILVIDDERDVRVSVEDLLSLIPDCHVEGAATFREGRSKTRQPWDLVISDFMLPDGNGVDLLAACAEEQPGTPRVLMTSFENHPMVVAALEGRALSGFIQKPFDPPEMIDQVQGLLGRSGPASRRWP